MRRVALLAVAVVSGIAQAANAACTAAVDFRPKIFAATERHVVAARLDGDAAAEIIAASSTALTVRRTATVTAPVSVYIGTALGNPVTGDFTGDGNVDVAVADGSAIVLLAGNGDGTFAVPVTTAIGFAPTRLVAGAFVADAKVDLAVAGSEQTIRFYSWNGAGAFAAAGQVAIGFDATKLIAANFDGDAFTDLAAHRAGQLYVKLLYPNGDGTAFVGQVGRMSQDPILAAGDLDGDGDDDFVQADVDQYFVHWNPGGRTIPEPQSGIASHDAIEGIASGDFSGDGVADLAVARWHPAPWAGLDIERVPGSSEIPYAGARWNPYDRAGRVLSLAVADFNGDGALDAVAMKDTPHGELLIQTCNSVYFSLPGQRKVSAGQPLLARVAVGGTTAAIPTGQVTLSEGSTPLCTMALTPVATYSGGYSEGSCTIENLPAGVHEITGVYGGDANYAPSEDTFYVVIADYTTTATLTSNAPDGEYGQHKETVATITASNGGATTGRVEWRVDGVDPGWGNITFSAPTARFKRPLDVGTHTLEARLALSDTDPPSDWGAITVTVRRTTSSPTLYPGATVSRHGQAAQISAFIQTPHYALVTGIARLMKGDVVLGTTSASSISFNVNGLAVGRHSLRLVYEGDANVAPSSLDFEHEVISAATVFPLSANGNATSVIVEFLRPDGAPNTIIYRRVAGGPWTQVGSGPTPFTDSTPGAAARQYRAEAYTSNNVLVATSNIDTARVVSFTDTELAGTPVKALHFEELLAAVNDHRATAGLLPVAASFSGIITAAQVVMLRNAMNDVRAAAGLPPIAFTDAITGGVTAIRALHLLELRGATR